MSVAGLLQAFEADDPDALLRLTSTVADGDRGTAWEAVLPRFHPRRWHAEDAALEGEAVVRRARTEALFCLAVGPPDVVRIVGGFVFATPTEDEWRHLLTLRTAAWQRAFASSSLHRWAAEKEVSLFGPWWWENWQRIRQHERAGLVPFDTQSADYLVALVRGLTFSDSIEVALLADPDLLRERVWDLFRPRDGVQRALMGSDRYWDAANTWRATLVRVALAGHLDPRRLRAEAGAAAADDRLGRNHRAWYRGIVTLLDDPAGLPEPASTGPPPPGSRLQR